MRDTMFIATAAFFAIYYGLLVFQSSYFENHFDQNNILWTAFMVYLAARGGGQALMLRRSVYNKAEA